MTAPVLKYDEACRAVAEARSIDEVLQLGDKAAAIAEYYRRTKNRSMEIDAAEIRIRAERKLGVLLAEEKAAGRLSEGRPPKNGSVEQPFSRVSLADVGVDKSISARAQAVARIPEAEFLGSLGRWREDMGRLGARVTANLLRERDKAARREDFAARTADGCDVSDLEALIEARRTFGAIYADPPWRFETWSAKGQDRSPGYRTDPLKAIAELPVLKLAARDCVLFLWVVGPMLREGMDLVDAWGFDLKTIGFTWMKQNASGEGLFLGPGYWTRANAELCLLATRGAPTRLDAGVPQAVLSPVQEHSRKPDAIHDRIERLVGGPYLELYARRPREGWATWGNEIERAAFAEAAAAPPMRCDEEDDAPAARYAADRSAKWGDADVAGVAELAAQRLSTVVIAQRLGMTRGAVKGIARRHGIKLLPRGGVHGRQVGSRGVTGPSPKTSGEGTR